MAILGEEDDLAKEARVLNRIVRWHPRKGITCEADPTHAEIFSREAGAEELKTISTPAAKDTGHETEGRRLSGTQIGAGCRRTRRSTSSGCIHRGQHMLKFWSKTQAVVALSSAKTELAAATKASQEVLGMMSLWKDIGETTEDIWWETQVQQSESSGALVWERQDTWTWVGRGSKRKKHHANCSTTKSKAATTALTCSPWRLTMTGSCDTVKKPWDVSSCLGEIQMHSLSTSKLQKWAWRSGHWKWRTCMFKTSGRMDV